MTTPRDDGPLAPRRPLGKPPTSADEESAASGGSGTPVQTVEQTTESRDRERAGSNGAPPARGAESPETTSEDAAATKPVNPTRSRPAESPAPPSPGADQPVSRPLYAPGPPRYSSPDADTQHSLPVPPVIPPTAPAPVDKRAEREAAKQQRKLEASKPRTVRRAKLRVIRLDPWSVTKTAFLLSIAFGIMCVVAVFLVFSIMSASGLWDSVNTTIQGVVNQRPDEAFDINDYVGMSRVMGITMLISAIDVVIITALATLGAFIYNMAASLLGGIEVTLAEDLH
jgi:hypothetical protein